MGVYYIMRPGAVVHEADDVGQWAVWFGTTWMTPCEEGGGLVGRDELPGGLVVSTVFLGLNQYGRGPPLLFETMVFDGVHDECQSRYATLEQAKGGHARAVAMATGEVPPATESEV